jgi:hypothetical protein
MIPQELKDLLTHQGNEHHHNGMDENTTNGRILVQIHNEFRDYNKMGNEMNHVDGGYFAMVMEMMISPPRIFVVLKIRCPRACSPSRSLLEVRFL